MGRHVLKLSNNHDVQPRLTNLENVKVITGLGTNSARKFAEESGALVRIGARCLYDVQLIYRHIDELEAAQSAKCD